MKLDDASWHYGGDYPAHLPEDAASTHMAMFVTWLITRGHEGELHTEECAEELSRLHAREITPRGYFLQCCDEKLTDEDYSEAITRFATSYYDNDYLNDYLDEFGDDVDSIYEVEDSWASFDRIAPRIDSKYEKWAKKRNALTRRP